MPNKRDLKLDHYEISKYKYRELSNFCYQYPEWLKKLQEINQESNIKSPDLENSVRCGDNASKVEKMALKAASLMNNIILIIKTF